MHHLIEPRLANLAYLARGISLNFREFWIVGRHFRDETIWPNQRHIEIAARWLLRAQEKGDCGGYSRLYCLRTKKWDRAYPETTGYIIPTMFKVATYLKEERFYKSALKAGRWLLKVQNRNGAFSDLDDAKELAFDTGQCLTGLIFLANKTNDSAYYEAAIRAGNWLVAVQDQDGSWTRFGYLNQPHTYYTRVAASLMQLSRLVGEQKYSDAAKRHLQWVLSQQIENSFFRRSGFSGDGLPFLHTMIYVLEGLLESWKVIKNIDIWQAMTRYAKTLADINLHRDLILYSQYNEGFLPINKEKCITGLAQWAGFCLQLYGLTQDPTYFQIGANTLYYLKSKQIKTGDNLKGSFPGSIPYYGRYAGLKLPNWSAKFFIDAMLTYEECGPLSLIQEQESWVSNCFSFYPHIVHKEIAPMERTYLNHIESLLADSLSHSVLVLDLGCGKGKFLDYFRSRYPESRFIGIDPFFGDTQKQIKKGSVSDIPMPDHSVDIIMTIEVLQHVKYLQESLTEIRRVLKPDGLLLIIDRNPLSFLGLLKPYLELMGKWMYPPDSPFSEKWYPLRKWRRSLKDAGFTLQSSTVMQNLEARIPLMDRYYLILCRPKPHIKKFEGLNI